MDTGPEMEKQQDHFAAPLNPEEVMASLKALRKNYQVETETAANSAKTANSQSRISQISHFSRVLHDENKEELQFLRDERAAIREFDGGMSRSRAEYLSVLDVPCLPTNSNNQT
jgi:CRISPR/Cas system CSM-associated protein Csm5 (group 7 of RAMP superfamily)